jgi:tripartite motif-containing protein 71
MRKMAAVLAAAMLMLLTVGGPPAIGAVSLSALRHYGGSGHAFLYGWGAGTAPDGSVYIGDYWNFEIKHFDTGGTFLGAFGKSTKGSGAGKHLSPYGIATDPAGNVYFGDVDAGRTVDKYDSAGNFLTEWGGVGNGPGKYQYPGYLDIASDGSVVIADSRSDNVVVTTPFGTERFAFGSTGTANGKFRTPRGVGLCHHCTVDPGSGQPADLIFVEDNNNGRIQVFRYRDGALQAPFVYKFGCIEDGVNPACHFAPGTNLRGLAVDEKNGWVYVVDAAGDDVEKFSLNGTHLLSFGGSGTDAGQFIDGGRDVTVDGLGRVWVGDMPNFRAQVFDPNGNFLFQVPDPPSPPPMNGFNGPSDVGVSTHGFMYVTDTRNQRVMKFSLSDAPGSDAVLAWGDRGKSAYGFNYPRAIAVDDSGISCPDPTDTCVLLADTDNGKIKKFTANGNFLWSLGGGTTPEGSLKAWALDVGLDGRIYVGNLRTADVAILSPSGTLLSRFGSQGTGNGQFVFIRGIAVDADGSIWVSDSGRKDIQHFSDSGQFLGKIMPTGSGDDSLAQAGDVVVDGQYVYVTDTKAHKIKIWTKGGTFVRAVGGGGKTLGRMFGPQGMDLVGNHLYTCEVTGERITDWRVTIS